MEESPQHATAGSTFTPDLRDRATIDLEFTVESDEDSMGPWGTGGRYRPLANSRSPQAAAFGPSVAKSGKGGLRQ